VFRPDSPSALTVGIDARAADEVAAGRGRVVREFLRALAARPEPHTYLCYARTPWKEPLDERFRWVLSADRDPLWHVRAARSASRRCDVFLSTNSYVTVPFLSVPAVTIVYDLVTFDPAMRPNRRSQIIERLTLGTAVRLSDALVCISHATADALVERFPGAASKVVVVPLGVSPALEPGDAQEGATNSLPDHGFLLAVGTLEPRKNLPRLVEAFASLPVGVQAAHPLVVVGAAGWSTGPTLAALRSLGDRCHILGHVSDAALAALYRRCGAFCYPSLGEGFGLPVLEAMQAGAPVITSDLSSLPEVGGDAVEYVDPRSVSGIATGLRRVLEDPELQARLSAAGPARAARFSWAQTAELTLATLVAAAGAGEGGGRR
jgi:glycosyltransferase involved in cell wall biosynthesis